MFTTKKAHIVQKEVRIKAEGFRVFIYQSVKETRAKSF